MNVLIFFFICPLFVITERYIDLIEIPDSAVSFDYNRLTINITDLGNVENIQFATIYYSNDFSTNYRIKIDAFKNINSMAYIAVDYPKEGEISLIFTYYALRNFFSKGTNIGIQYEKKSTKNENEKTIKTVYLTESAYIYKSGEIKVCQKCRMGGNRYFTFQQKQKYFNSRVLNSFWDINVQIVFYVYSFATVIGLILAAIHYFFFKK